MKAEMDGGVRISAEAIATGYKPEILYGASLNEIQNQIQSRLPAGSILATNNGRFHFETSLDVDVPGASAATPERFQREFARQLDSTLSTLTPLDEHFRCSTAWFEQTAISGDTATAKLHVEGWYNANTAPSLFADQPQLIFSPIATEDDDPQTLRLRLANTSSAEPLNVTSYSLSGTGASAFELFWNAGANPSMPARGASELEISIRAESIARLPPGTHTATLEFRTANGVPATVLIPLSLTVAAPLFVDQSAPPGGDGSAWAKAFRTITAAVTAAPTGNEAILVADGVYSEAVSLRASLRLYGGFAGLDAPQETRLRQRDPSARVTIISGALGGINPPAVHVVNFAGSDNAIVDGFTITGGRASGDSANGAGVNISEVSGRTIVRHCVIQNNRADGDGGGIHVQNSAALIEHCDILDNEARNGGGLFLAGDEEIVVRDCWIAGNRANWRGGVSFDGAKVLIENSRIVANTATEIGGGFVGNGGLMRGVLVALNEARHSFGGGGTYGGQHPVELEHCVVYRNRADNYFAGLGAVYRGTLRVRNSILAGHDGGGALGLGWGNDQGRLDARHCLFFDNVRHFTQSGQAEAFAVDAPGLNRLTNYFQHALVGNPLWVTPPRPAGTVASASYTTNSRLTILTLTGANLIEHSLRGTLVAKNANEAAAVFDNTATSITVFGRHDSVTAWSQWRPLDFHLTSGSPAIDTGTTTTSTSDPDGFPRGVDLSSVANGAGDGYDLGLYEHRGDFATQPLVSIQPNGGAAALRWPLGMAGWRVHSSADLRRWTPISSSPFTTNGWQQLPVPTGRAQEFYRLTAP